MHGEADLFYYQELILYVWFNIWYFIGLTRVTRSLFCLFCGRFKWSNMMDDDEKTATNDIDEDMVSMMFAAGLWHMEHAHWVKFFIFIFIFFLSKRQLLWFVSKLWLVSNFCKYTMYAMAQEARTPLYKPCSMCSPKGYGLWAFLVWKQVHTFCLFWSGMG